MTLSRIGMPSGGGDDSDFLGVFHAEEGEWQRSLRGFSSLLHNGRRVLIAILEEERSIKFGSTSETQSSKRMLQKDSCCWSISYGRLSSVGQEEREKKGGKSLKVHYILSSLLCTVTKLSRKGKKIFSNFF